MIARVMELLLVALAPDPAQDAARAEVAVAEAVALHADGKLEEASAALERAYAIYPDRDYLYMRGVIEREAGHCDDAEALFDAFIAENPPLVDIQAAQDQREKCAATLPTPAEAPPEPTPPPRPLPEPRAVTEAPPQPLAIEDRPPPPRSWREDRVGHALLGSGLAVAVLGGGLLGGAAQRASAADDASTAGDYREGIATARALNVAGFAAVGLATSLAISGIVHYVVFSRRAR